MGGVNTNYCSERVFFRFKRLTGRHDAQIYESDYKYFAARVKNRRTPQHNLSTITVLQVPTYLCGTFSIGI